jgi:hypothetical protein
MMVILSAKGDLVKDSGQAGSTQVAALLGDGLETGEKNVATSRSTSHRQGRSKSRGESWWKGKGWVVAVMVGCD